MALHPILSPTSTQTIARLGVTALRTAQSMQTRKGGSAFYPTGDGQGVLVGGMADHGVDKWDPETGEQSPLWEGISQEELDAKGEEILGAAKEDTAAQITLVNTTITEAQQAIEANREGIEAEAYLRAEGDKLAQDAAAAVKTETDRLSTKYDEMDTSVKNVKNDLKNVMTSTTQLEQDMIVSTLIEYAVGDSDTTPPDVTTYWMGEPNNSVSVLSDPWSPDTPERTPGTYVWMRTRVTFGDGGQETSAPVLVTGNTGAQGPQGPQGVAGAKGDKGEDGVTRYSYFAYGTSASGANFSTTPTSASTYIGVCVTTAATQPTDPTKYTWSLTKGATGPAGPQGAAGAKGDVGEDGKTYYTYFAYGTSASGANFSKTPTTSSTYMGVCITLDTTQPTDANRYTWSLTKGNQGATGAQGVSVSALTPFWQLSESKPAQPVNKSPGGGWTSTEPSYVRGKKLWTCSRIDYSNGQWSWTSVQQSSAFDAAELALTTANGKNRRYVQPSTPVVDANELTQGDEWWQTSSKPPETYWTGTPNNSVSVLVDHSNEVEHIWVWNGKRWALNRLSAEDIIVSGSVAAGLVTADFFDGARIRGGAFLTSNERIQLNNNGFVMVDAQGNPVVTLDAKTGEAILQSVNIIGAGLSTPAISGGSIEGADYKLTAGTGADKTTVARINSSGIIFGDHLSYAKNEAGQWVLAIEGAIQSGGEISGAVITAPTLQTSSAENTGLKLTTGGLVAYDADGNTTFTLDTAGQIMMAGAVLSNATLTAPILQTNPAENRGIKIAGQTFTAFRNDGTKMINIDVNGTGVAEFTGTFRTGSSGSVMEMLSYSSGVSSVQGGGQLRSVIGDKTVWNMWGHYGESGYAGQLWEYTWGLGVAGSDFLTAKVTNTGSQMFIQADTVRISSTTAGGGVYVNGRRIDWEQAWTDIALANGSTAVGAAQFGQRAGLLVFRGRIKCTGNGDCDLFDLASVYSGFETSTVNRTWIIGTMTNGIATTARAYIPANSTMLRVNNGPHEWVDIGSIVIGL